MQLFRRRALSVLTTSPQLRRSKVGVNRGCKRVSPEELALEVDWSIQRKSRATKVCISLIGSNVRVEVGGR
jgi:hypothetical protein